MMILNKIRAAVREHTTKTGRPPTRLYVSADDYARLRRAVEELTHAPYGVSEGHPDSYDGMVIYQVVGEHPLTVM